MSVDPLAILSGGLIESGSIYGTNSLLADLQDVPTKIRKKIRENLQNQSTAQNRIYVTPFVPVDGEVLHRDGPILLVYTGGERIDRENPISIAPPRFSSFVEVFVDIVASSYLPDLQDALGAISLGVRAIVLRDATQGGNCDDTKLIALTPRQGDPDGAHPFTALQLEFECEYEFGEIGDDLVSDAFERIHAGWDPKPDGAPDGVLEATDDIELDQ